MQSVVRTRPAIEAAFYSANRVTLAGSMTPIDSMSPNSPTRDQARPVFDGHRTFTPHLVHRGRDQVANQAIVVCRDGGPMGDRIQAFFDQLEQNEEWSLNRRYTQLEGLQTVSETAPTRLPAVAR